MWEARLSVVYRTHTCFPTTHTYTHTYTHTQHARARTHKHTQTHTFPVPKARFRHMCRGGPCGRPSCPWCIGPTRVSRTQCFRRERGLAHGPRCCRTRRSVLVCVCMVCVWCVCVLCVRASVLHACVSVCARACCVCVCVCVVPVRTCWVAFRLSNCTRK